MKNFNNKVAAITGAGSGIGQQLAVLLAKQGCHLALSDVNEQGLAKTVELLKGTDVRVTTKRSMWLIWKKCTLGPLRSRKIMAA